MKERGKQKKLIGTVVSDTMDKTVVVQVRRLKRHVTYKKYIREHKKFMAHDPQNKCKVGDKVRLIETRPLSKRKRWQITEVLEGTDLGVNAENSEAPELEK